MTKPAIAFAVVFSVACGGADKKTADTPEPTGEPTAVAPAEVLTIAPFVLTITGTKSDGTTQTRVFRGSADGVISGEKDGETRELVKVTADGTFTPLVAEGAPVVKLDANGSLTIDGKPFPGARVGEDGTVYRGADPLIKIEGGKVIALIDGIMSSKVSMNGQVVSETRYEMTVEGGDEVRRLVGAVLLLQMTGRSDEAPAPTSREVEATPATP